MNEKSIWELLEIEPTNDKQKIRKAYAQQTKSHHLEEDPQAFGELNRAYQQALQYAKAVEGKADEGSGEGRGTAESRTDLNGEKCGADQEVAESRTDLNGEESDADREVEGSCADLAEKSGVQDREKGIEKTEKSLLEKLAQAEQKAIEQSREKGALGRLIALLEDEKNAKKAEVFRNYFLSEDFLNEQFDDKFGKGLMQFVEEKYFNAQGIEWQSLPRPLIIELAIAYGL